MRSTWRDTAVIGVRRRVDRASSHHLCDRAGEWTTSFRTHPRSLERFRVGVFQESIKQNLTIGELFSSLKSRCSQRQCFAVVISLIGPQPHFWMGRVFCQLGCGHPCYTFTRKPVKTRGYQKNSHKGNAGNLWRRNKPNWQGSEGTLRLHYMLWGIETIRRRCNTLGKRGQYQHKTGSFRQSIMRRGKKLTGQEVSEL